MDDAAQAANRIVVAPWSGVPAVPSSRKRLSAMAQILEALNVANAGVTIRGAGSSVTLFRKFHVTLDFGGRHYGPAYLNAPVDERLGITMNGEPVVEVDLKAAQVTILAGLAGLADATGALPFSDPYELPGLPRAAAKRWTTRTLGRGGAALWRRQDERWDAADPSAVRAVPFGDVKEAMVARFNFLEDLRELVPPGVLNCIPKALRGKAAGLYFTAREAEIVAAAMAYCVARGCPVLPVHDAVLVPASREMVGVAALTDATFALAGVVPRVEVEGGGAGLV